MNMPVLSRCITEYIWCVTLKVEGSFDIKLISTWGGDKSCAVTELEVLMSRVASGEIPPNEAVKEVVGSLPFSRSLLLKTASCQLYAKKLSRMCGSVG